MVIIFYDSDREQIYICTEREKMKVIPLDDDDIMSHIPNDDILYVQNAHCITKSQFQNWLAGEMILQDATQDPHRFTGFMDEGIRAENQVENPLSGQMQQTISKYADSKWIHPAHHGTVLIEDLKTQQYPDGVVLNGKWDFVPVDALGGFDALDESLHYRTLLAKGKIKVVDYEYVKKNRGKKKQVSNADAALDAIIVKDSRAGSAESAAAGGMGAIANDGAIEMLIE